jgi:tRNA(Arg) A34 adenosine deaminase TadA
MTDPARLVIDLPGWVEEIAARRAAYPTDDDRIALAIELARENVLREGGGPFGAVVFEETTGKVVAAAVNRVQQLANCALHAEVTALMFAQQRLGCHTFQAEDGPSYMLASSCDPCAMCLGAVLWSGIQRVVCGATREDAMAVGFDEGPVFPESLLYLQERGISITSGLRRQEASEVLQLYADRGGLVYNGIRATS